MIDSSNYGLASELFLRLLGLIYFFAFFPFLFQIRGLLGKNGILPVESHLERIRSKVGKKSYYYLPSLFWFHCTDVALLGVALAGTILSAVLFFGLYPALVIPLLFILYLSIVNVGQDFLSFGWEMFLLEITCNAFFLSLTPSPNPFVWISLNLLLFRFHFQAGAVKLQSKDTNWRNLTALSYHYQTQPIPNTQAWFFHKLPMWFHKLSCIFMFVVELIVPFTIFGTDEMRFFAFLAFVSLQVIIWFSGNFSYLNHMTVTLCVILLYNPHLEPILGPAPISTQTPLSLEIFVSIFGCILITLQLLRLWHHFSSNADMNRWLGWFAPFHIVNRYGIFAVMTTKRYEIVVEGSMDGDRWEEYLFKHKPSEISRRPRRISPFQPRLDWQVWFLPFSSWDREHWLQNFALRLLQGKKEVLSLLRYNPFPKTPPRYIRIKLFEYVFSDWKSWWKDGNWWKRDYIGFYSPTVEQNKN